MGGELEGEEGKEAEEREPSLLDRPRQMRDWVVVTRGTEGGILSVQPSREKETSPSDELVGVGREGKER